MAADPGLSSAEASLRRQRCGLNALPRQRRPPLALRLLRQFHSPLIYILVFALLVDVAVWIAGGAAGVPFEPIGIAAILALNSALGVWQEHKAEHILESLTALAEPRVWVWRDGLLAHRPSSELVPGDLIRLDPGDRVPADVVAREAVGIEVDESVLTGESLPVEKHDGEVLLAGTLLVRGTVRALVARTGAESALGRLSVMIGTVRRERTPLERQLDVFGRRVAHWVIAVAALLVVAGLLSEGVSRAGHVVLFAAALAVASVPEGLPAVMTLTLMRGVQRMARRQALVRRLLAVEALGAVTVIATDKTGTLTEGRLEVRSLDAPDEAEALEAMVLASEADAASGAADPVDVAMLRFAGLSLDSAALHAGAPRRSARPFDATARFTRATVHRDGGIVSYLKGAPEVVLDRCAASPEERERWHARIEARAAEGFRVLALARGDGERETDLRWLGLALLWDPPRPEVPGAVRRAREAGIRVLMLTGDHPGTARTVARDVGIDDTAVLTGAEVDALSDERLREAVGATTVFARLSPSHKLRIVEALQAAGNVVAVTGDGVNDAPALKRADVGVAMGERGSDVAREVSDLVLLDDNFATIVAAVEEGRGIYENIQKFVRFLISTNLSELLLVVGSAAAAFTLELRDAGGALLLPLTAIQLLWINLVTDGLPALALGLDHNPDAMHRAPRAPDSPLLDRRSRQFIFRTGGCLALLGLALLGGLPRALGVSLPQAATATFVFVAAAQLLVVYPARRTDLRPPPNGVLHAVVWITILLQLALPLLPDGREILGLVPLPGLAWVAVLATLAVAAAAIALLQRVVWRPAGAAGSGPRRAGDSSHQGESRPSARSPTATRLTMPPAARGRRSPPAP